MKALKRMRSQVRQTKTSSGKMKKTNMWKTHIMGNLHMGDDLPNGDYPAQMNMMSFINESDDYSHIHLASAKQTEGIPTEETFVNELIEKPIEYAKNHKSQSLTKSSMLNQITNKTSP